MKDDLKIEGIEFMGNNVRSNLKYCGNNVRLYPLCKIIRSEVVELLNNCQIFDNVFIDGGKGLKVGEFTTITWNVIIEGIGNTTLGNRVFIGPGSKLLTSMNELNGFYAVDHLPSGQAKIKYGSIVIENDAYVGANCTILTDVKIGEGAVVGANSLVLKDLEPWGIYVGSPCKKIGVREKPNF